MRVTASRSSSASGRRVGQAGDDPPAQGVPDQIAKPPVRLRRGRRRAARGHVVAERLERRHHHLHLASVSASIVAWSCPSTPIPQRPLGRSLEIGGRHGGEAEERGAVADRSGDRVPDGEQVVDAGRQWRAVAARFEAEDPARRGGDPDAARRIATVGQARRGRPRPPRRSIRPCCASGPTGSGTVRAASARSTRCRRAPGCSTCRRSRGRRRGKRSTIVSWWAWTVPAEQARTVVGRLAGVVDVEILQQRRHAAQAARRPAGGRAARRPPPAAACARRPRTPSRRRCGPA